MCLCVLCVGCVRVCVCMRGCVCICAKHTSASPLINLPPERVAATLLALCVSAGVAVHSGERDLQAESDWSIRWKHGP